MLAILIAIKPLSVDPKREKASTDAAARSIVSQHAQILSHKWVFSLAVSPR